MIHSDRRVGLTDFLSAVTANVRGALVVCRHPQWFPHVSDNNKVRNLDDAMVRVRGRRPRLFVVDGTEPGFQLSDLGILPTIKNITIIVGGEGPIIGTAKLDLQFRFEAQDRPPDEPARVLHLPGQSFEVVMTEMGLQAIPYSSMKKPPKTRFELMFEDD